MAESVYGDGPTHGRSTVSRLSLHAVFAGVITALVTQLMLMVLGAAIGLTAFEPNRNVAAGVGVGFLVWTLLALCVASFLGAWIATVVARTSLRREGLIHAFVTWSTATLLGLWLVGSLLGNALGGAFDLVGRAAGVASRSPATQQDQRQLRQEGRQRLGQLQQQAQDPAQRQEAAQRADQAAQGAAIGLWGLFALHLIPLLCALAGGLAGVRSEGRALTPTIPTRRDVATPGPSVPQPT